MRADPSLKAIVVLAGLVIVIVGLRLAGGFFLPMLTALFLAVISAPIVRFLRDRAKLPSPIAILITLLLDMGLLAAFVALIATSFDGLLEALPRYQVALGNLSIGIAETLRGWGLTIGGDELDPTRDAQSMMGVAGLVLHELTQLVSNTVLVVLLLGFMLFEMSSVRHKLGILIGSANPHFEKLASSATDLQRYLVIKTVLSVLTGVLSGCWFAACGVDFPLLWGLLTFLFNYIPSIGPALALIPPLIISLLTLGPGGAAAVAAGHLSIGFVIGNLLEPRMMGQTLGISTLVVFGSMLFWGWLWGPVGALFAVPLTMLIRSALETSDETRWIAVLLSSSEYGDERRREWGWTTPEERSRQSVPPPPLEAPVARSKDAAGEQVPR